MARNRGQVRKRGEEKYLIRIYLGRVDGKRKYKSKMVYGDEDHAEEQLTKMLRQKDRGLITESSDKKLDSFLDEWLEAKKGRIQPSTYEGYSHAVNGHIRPALGHRDLDDVNSRLIQTFINQLSDEKDLSASYIRNIHGVLRQVMKLAVRWELIPINPADADRLNLPRRQQRDYRTLSKEEVGRLLGVTEGSRFHALWLLLISTGLRPQEAFGLKWKDLEDRWLHTRRVISVAPEESDTWYQVSDQMKTRSSKRKIKIPEHLQKRLKEHRSRQAEEMLAAGKQYERRGFVFTRSPESGNFLYSEKANRAFQKALEAAGLDDEGIRLYDLRHTHISRLIMDGTDLKLASSRAGHSSIQQTADTYTHLNDEAEEQMADATEQMLQEAVGSN